MRVATSSFPDLWHALRPALKGLALLLGALCALALSPPTRAMDRVTVAPQGIGQPYDQAGAVVAVFGDTAAIAAPKAGVGNFYNSGAVEIDRNVAGTWQVESLLLPGTVSADMQFGSSLALGTDVIVVAAPGSPDQTGAFYTFARSGSTWAEVDHFSATATAGYAVALSGDTLIVGGGAVYARSGDGWSLQAQLQGDDGEIFGVQVAIDGDLAAVASMTSQNVGFPVYHFYVNFFSRSGGVWTRETKLDVGEFNAIDSPFLNLAVSGQTAVVATQAVVEAVVRAQGAWSVQGTLDPLSTLFGFGTSIALQQDTAVVGSPYDDVLGFSGGGSAFVFTRVGSTWSRSAHFADPHVGDFSYAFGMSVALSGDALVVGAPGANTAAGNAGDATVFDLQGDSWTAVATLDLGDAHANEEFGQAVAREAATLIAGAPSAHGISPYVDGAAYVFDYAQGTWSQSARLLPSLDHASQLFGRAVALDADTAAIGASDDDVSGAIYVFSRGDGTWPQQARLDGATGNAFLGASVALHADVLAAGEPGQINPYGNTSRAGSVRLFARSGTEWSQQAVLESADGHAGDEFGLAIAMDDVTLVIGAPRADIGIEQDAGAVYVFGNVDGVWVQQAKLVAPTPASGNAFGVSVALAGDALVVGAGWEDPVASPRGAAYVYARSAGIWTLQSELRPPEGTQVGGSFGHSVALSGTGITAVVGEPAGGGPLLPTGVIHVFTMGATGWEWSGTRQPPPPDPNLSPAGFGTSLAMDGENAIVGAPTDGGRGAVYELALGDSVYADGFEAPARRQR